MVIRQAKLSQLFILLSITFNIYSGYSTASIVNCLSISSRAGLTSHQAGDASLTDNQSSVSVSDHPNGEHAVPQLHQRLYLLGGERAMLQPSTNKSATCPYKHEATVSYFSNRAFTPSYMVVLLLQYHNAVVYIQ